MSTSSVGSVSSSMAAAVSVTQSQAVQYATYFRELVLAVDAADLGGAKRALSDFGRVSAMAAANGFDPVNQVPSLAKEFVSIRKALVKGDLRLAQAALSNLRKELGVVEGGQTETRPQEGLSTTETSGAIDGGARQKSISARVQTAENTAGTAITVDPALTSFSQVPRVFPTSSALSPVVTSSRQLVSHESVAMLSDAAGSAVTGTAFAPLPEMMLGSRGMSIPEGALLELADVHVLPPTFAFSR